MARIPGRAKTIKEGFIMSVAWVGVAVAGAGVASSAYGAYQAGQAGEQSAEQAEENARLAKEMGNYNADISDGKARQAIENSLYDAQFAEMQTITDIFMLDHAQSVKQNQAVYEEEVATAIAQDGGINQIRKRKKDILDLATIEATSAGVGALKSGSVLAVMNQTAMNMEIDSLEIGRLANLESDIRRRNANTLKEEASLLGTKKELAQTYGEIQQESILREGQLLSKDYKDEATRLRKYGAIDASNYLASASQSRAQASIAQTQSFASGVNSIATGLSIYQSAVTKA